MAIVNLVIKGTLSGVGVLLADISAWWWSKGSPTQGPISFSYTWISDVVASFVDRRQSFNEKCNYLKLMATKCLKQGHAPSKCVD